MPDAPAAKSRKKRARKLTFLFASLALLLALLLALCGCESCRFYGQAARGQWQMLTAPKPIADFLASTNTPPKLRAQLEFVLRVRTFAERELHLSAHRHYLNYADLGRRYAVWTIYAAPEFSLEARSWWYPLVGSLKYRGYFNERSARDYAAKIRTEGQDVFVGGVEAYSTLGWFPDPVLNTFINRDEDDLAEVLFHELTHQKVFISGDTDFNEAFATANAQEGVRRWFRAEKKPEALAKYEAGLGHETDFSHLIFRTRDELTALYARTNLPPETMRAEKAAAFDRLRASYGGLKETWGGRGEYDRWFAKELNNARLNTISTYYELVPGFAALLKQQDGDSEKFYKEVRKLGRKDKDERQRVVKALGEK
ncbi:MAG: aminopeptidase [Verrucomicrobia bacterium]|nr:aminopeptidase [Verrucomicrobiota bacterium]